MTDQQKNMYFDLGLRMCGVQCDKQMVELIWTVIEGIQRKGGDFTLLDYAVAKRIVSEKHKKLSKKSKK